MQPRPSFDRSLLLPVAISVVSILGICLILLTGYRGRSFTPPTASPSSVLTFEAVTRSPLPSPTATRDETPPSATGTRPESYPGPLAETPVETFPSTGTLIPESLPTPSATPTPYRIQPLQSGKHDDTDPNIAYDPHWTALKNSSTAISYKGTIHASTAIGNEAFFRFTGKQFRLGYQRGNTFGTLTVLVDGQPYGFHEQAFDLVWSSPELAPGDHFVRIIHDSGESVNLDYIEIRN